MPITQIPAFLSFVIVSAILVTRLIKICSIAPADAFTTADVTSVALSFGIITP